MHRKNTRMNLLPFLMANLAPSIPPMELHTAIGKAIPQMILPFKMNNMIEPILVATLIIFALEDD